MLCVADSVIGKYLEFIICAFTRCACKCVDENSSNPSAQTQLSTTTELCATHNKKTKNSRSATTLAKECCDQEFTKGQWGIKCVAVYRMLLCGVYLRVSYLEPCVCVIIYVYQLIVKGCFSMFLLVRVGWEVTTNTEFVEIEKATFCFILCESITHNNQRCLTVVIEIY